MEQNEPQRNTISGQVMRFQRVTSTMDVAWQLVETAPLLSIAGGLAAADE